MASIEAMLEWGVKICNDDRYLYGGARNSYASGGFYFDCSSFVNFAINAGGWETPGYAPINGAFYTGNMGDELVRLGFTAYASNKITEYLPGDIGVNHSSESQHTEIFYKYDDDGNALWMGAHGQNGYYATNKAAQVSIKARNSGFNTIYRWEDGVEPSGYTVTNYYVLAAMCGNFQAESFICPNTWESGIVMYWDYEYEYTSRGGYGLGQWTNVGTPHGRLYNLIAWMLENGYDTTSGVGEASYIVKEDVWTQNVSGYSSEYASLTDFMQSDSEDLYTLTYDWMRCWEGINGNISDRHRYAQHYLTYLQEHIDDEDIKSWQLSDSNYALSENAMNNNAVMLSRFMRDAYGIEGTNTSIYNSGETSTEQLYTENSNVTGANVKSFSIWDLFYSMLGLIGSAGGKSRKLRIKRRR